MKIIDLLNKIANDVKLPKKIKYKNCIFENRCVIDYWCKKTETCLDELILMQNLNDEVEIIEEEIIEEKKIPEKMENEHEFYSYAKYDEKTNEIDKVLYILKAINLAEEKIGNLNNSVNEIIDYLKSKGDE